MQACEGEHPAQIKHITSALPAYRQRAGSNNGGKTRIEAHLGEYNLTKHQKPRGQVKAQDCSRVRIPVRRQETSGNLHGWRAACG